MAPALYIRKRCVEIIGVLDIIFILIVAALAFVNFRRGFAAAVFSFVAFWLSGIITAGVYPIIAKMINDSPIYGMIEPIVRGALFNNAPSAASRNIESVSISPVVLKFIAGAEQVGEALVSSAEEKLVAAVTTAVISGLCMVVTFLAMFIVFRIVGRLLRIVNHLPVLGGVNRLFGAALGILEGAAIVLVMVCVMMWIPGELFAGLLGGSAIAGFAGGRDAVGRVFAVVSGLFTK